jgi:hypothetical protein
MKPYDSFNALTTPVSGSPSCSSGDEGAAAQLPRLRLGSEIQSLSLDSAALEQLSKVCPSSSSIVPAGTTWTVDAEGLLLLFARFSLDGTNATSAPRQIELAEAPSRASASKKSNRNVNEAKEKLIQ